MRFAIARFVRGGCTTLRAGLALAALASAACTSTPAPGDAGARADATTDTAADAGRCVAAGTICVGAQLVRCDAPGAAPVTTACIGATPACTDGVGCTACRAGTTRCAPTDPGEIQRCTDDGATYVAASRCDDPARPVCAGGRCADPCADGGAQAGSVGCDFWAVSTANYVDAMFSFALAVSNPQGDPVRVRVTGGALAAPVERVIAAGGLELITLPWVAALALNGASNVAVTTRAPGGAYHLASSAPVAAYQFNPLEYQLGARLSQSNDASLLLPTGALTGHYVVTTYPSMRPSPFFALVGVAPGTTTVTLRTTTDLAAGADVERCAAGTTHTFSLAQGEVLQFMPEPVPTVPPGTTDPSGTTVDATQPLGVFAGHSCAYVPAGNGFCDHLEEQLMPVETWGREALVTPFADRPDVPSLVRVTAQRDGTRVSFEPASVHAAVTLAARQFVELETTLAFQVQASDAISVAQYMSGERPRMTATSGSPAMVLHAPAEQFRAQYAVLVPSTYVHNYVNIVARAGVAPRVDGADITAAPQPIGVSGWVYFQLELSPGTHRFDSGATPAPFGITAYGVAPNTSYAYPGGIDLSQINPPG